MLKNQIIIVILLTAIFSVIFGLAYLLPIFFAKTRTKHYGLEINFKQARFLSKNKCLQKDFIIGVREIWKIYPLELDKLVNHYFAGGDLDNLKIGINEMLVNNKKPNLTMLTAMDLAKRDLKTEVGKAILKDWKFEF